MEIWHNREIVKCTYRAPRPDRMLRIGNPSCLPEPTMNRTRTLLLGAAGLTAVALALACGGGSGTVNPPAATGGTVGFMTTDATSETWSSVGVIIRKAYLVLQSDPTAASPVQIYDGSADLTQVDLLQEDQVQDLLGQVTGVPAGVYDRLIVEVDGTPGNITLVPAPVAGVVQSPIASSLITVRGTADTAHPTWMVLPTIKLSSVLTVADNQASAVAVDFDLAHPAFIVAHDVLASDGTTETAYAVNFNAKGAFRHSPAASLDKYYLRRHRGTVTSVAANGASFTLLTEHGQTLTILADTTSPTLFYNLDVTPITAVTSTTVPATVLSADAVECTARYQADGTLNAVRVWYTAGANASKLPAYRPEGHIARVDAANGFIYVLDSAGNARKIAVDTSTKWFFKGNTGTDISAGAGAAFLTSIDRYFKVNLTVNPLVTPPVAATVDIQRAVFEGRVSAPSATGFTYTRTWGDATVSTHNLGYDSTFTYWDFTFPGLASANIDTAGSPSFVTEASGTITLGTSTFTPYASSSLDWITGSGWQAHNAIFLPVQLSALAQKVVSFDVASGNLVVTPNGSTTNVTVTLDATSQEQPLVTTFTKQGGVVTVATQTAANWASVFTAGAKVRAFGVPDGSGNLKGYYVNIYN